MINIADKFLRSGLNEGDTYFATTANSAKSRESLEDNIDDKLVTHVGIDSTGGSVSSSVTETKIGEVIVSANTVRKRLIIIAGVRLNVNVLSTNTTTTFRIRTGTSATATSNTQRFSNTLRIDSDSAAGRGIVGCFLLATVTDSDETFTGQIYAHVTAENDVNNANVTGTCDFVYVLGI